MFNLGISEMLVIAILALVLIGPKQLPEVARMFGRFLSEFRRTTDAFKDEFAESSRKIMDSAKQDEKSQKPPVADELEEQYSELASPAPAKKEESQS